VGSRTGAVMFGVREYARRSRREWTQVWHHVGSTGRQEHIDMDGQQAPSGRAVRCHAGHRRSGLRLLHRAGPRREQEREVRRLAVPPSARPAALPLLWLRDHSVLLQRQLANHACAETVCPVRHLAGQIHAALGGTGCGEHPTARLANPASLVAPRPRGTAALEREVTGGCRAASEHLESVR
jgi:hypothetical protein